MKELIVIICNHDSGDDVMNVARSAGAKGGTILNGRGTAKDANIFNIMFQEQKEVVLIVADDNEKLNIMREVNAKLGEGTKAQAVCFSVPVDATCGFNKQIIKEAMNNEEQVK